MDLLHLHTWSSCAWSVSGCLESSLCWLYIQCHCLHSVKESWLQEPVAPSPASRSRGIIISSTGLKHWAGTQSVALQFHAEHWELGEEGDVWELEPCQVTNNPNIYYGCRNSQNWYQSLWNKVPQALHQVGCYLLCIPAWPSWNRTMIGDASTNCKLINNPHFWMFKCRSGDGRRQHLLWEFLELDFYS